MSDRATRILGPQEWEEAAALLRAGALVVFPTETVYGLGARADDETAVRAIFEAKGRPADNPLIVHLSSAAAIDERIARLDDRSRRLLEIFAPGPLTVIVKRGEAIGDAVTAGLPTVGLRVPDHPLALRLLEAAACPVAAPSANRSGRPSPTDLASAREHMEGRVDAILDGGPCSRGLESTVVRVEPAGVRILREGAIPHEALVRALDGEPVFASGEAGGEGPARAPGTRHPHYRPRAPLRWMPVQSLLAALEADRDPGLRAIALRTSVTEARGADPRLVMVADLEDFARRLYALLHAFDREEATRILVEWPPDRGLGRTLRDRLRRAAAGEDGPET